MSLRGKIILKKASIHRLYCLWVVIFVFTTGHAVAQHRTIPRTDTAIRTIDTTLVDSLNVSADSLNVKVDSLAKPKNLEQRLGIKISPDALTEVVVATSRDSAIADMDNNIFYLYGKAKVVYDDMVLEAGEIMYNQANSNVTAGPQFDTAGNKLEKPTFAQGSEKVIYDSLQYNFKSKRAIVRNANSQYGEGFLHSQQVKRNPDQSIYGLHNVYTTCALDTPHFGIVTKKIKVIPNRVAASGPANIAIEGVPTPLFLPFGLFPISSKQRSGFILPTYTVEENRGLGLMNGGYYFFISEKMDLLAQLNIFSKGSWQASGTSHYKSIYKYSGDFSYNYAYNKSGESYEPGSSIGREFMITWQHLTDPKARPGQNFTASVRIGTSSFYSNTSYNPQQVVDNQYQSNLTYSKNWIGKPFNLTVSGRHNQNTLTGLVDVTLPQIAFNISSISPFQNKNYVGKPRWFDNITMSYTLDEQNNTKFYDSAFDVGRLKFQSALKHTIPISASYTIARFVRANFSIPYTEYWYTEELKKQYNDATGKLDSTQRGGFFAARDYNFSIGLNTQIFGTKLFKKGSLRGIRHRLEPNVAFTYRPDFSKSPYGFYYNTRLDTSQIARAVYRYETGASLIGQAPSGELRSMSFGLNNNLQIKVRNNKDTSAEATGFKNITLIDGLGINTSYNFAADSLQWAPIVINFRTNILDKISISASANFDQYGINPATDRSFVRYTMWERGDGIARFNNANISASTSLTSKPRTKDDKAVVNDRNNGIVFNPDYYNYVDFDIPWSINLSYSLGVQNDYIVASKKDTITIGSNSINFGGDFNVTPRWKVSVYTGYNFVTKELQATRIQIFRDLHCWAMRLETVPFGPNKNYNFTINVKAAVLQDLKLMRRRDFRDL
jgi:lipopolysaccharide export system protein LptA